MPVMNYLQDALLLKPDTQKCLEIEPFEEQVTYINDFLSYCELNDDYNVILVDHNSLSFNYPCSSSLHSKISSKITKIIDHHSPSNQHPEAEIMLDTVASCCTLIYNPSLSAHIKKLILLTILVDSNNLSPSNGKTTKKDIEVVGSILKDLSLSKSDIFKKSEEISSAKFSSAFWSSLSKSQAISVDYKLLTVNSVRIGVASILTPLSTYTGDLEIEVDCLIIGSCVITGGEVKRELELVPGSSEDVCKKVEEWLNGGAGKLETIKEGMYWRQENERGSRKVLMPELEKVFMS